MSQPKKTREFVKDLSKKLDLDQNMVDDVVQFYWETIRDAIYEPKHCNIYVRGLGTFNIAKKKMYDNIKRMTHKVNELNELHSFKVYKTKLDCKNKLAYLERCLRFVQIENEKKYLKKHHNE